MTTTTFLTTLNLTTIRKGSVAGSVVRVTLTIAPGIWRNPHWILTEFERVAIKYRTTSLMRAVEIVCRRYRWRCTAAPLADHSGQPAVIISIFPMQPRPQILDGDVAVPCQVWDSP